MLVNARDGASAQHVVAAERLAAVRAAAARAGVDIVVNARIDAYLHERPGATPAVLARARRYLDAGAGCVYPLRLDELASGLLRRSTLNH